MSNFLFIAVFYGIYFCKILFKLHFHCAYLRGDFAFFVFMLIFELFHLVRESHFGFEEFYLFFLLEFRLPQLTIDLHLRTLIFILILRYLLILLPPLHLLNDRLCFHQQSLLLLHYLFHLLNLHMCLPLFLLEAVFFYLTVL